METKMLSFQSFEHNQTILGLINKLIIFIKLQAKGIDPRISEDEFLKAKEVLIRFLTKLNDSLIENKTYHNVIFGMDERNRMLVRNFLDAKSRSQKFKSILFKKSPSDVIHLLENINPNDQSLIIDSLSELRTLIEEHLTIDVKELIGEI